MTVRLRSIRRDDLPSFVEWREAARPYLRTPFMLNLDQQIQWYEDVVCDRRATDRFWAIEAEGDWPTYLLDARDLSPVREHGWRLIGIGGLTEIQFENGLAEITLVLDPAQKGKGHGEQAFDLVLSEAFDAMRLETVIAEVYRNNPALGFWENMADKWDAYRTVLPRRKYWAGAHHDGIYFSFSATNAQPAPYRLPPPPPLDSGGLMKKGI